MRNRYRVRATLTLMMGLPCAPALAATPDDPVDLAMIAPAVVPGFTLQQASLDATPLELTAPGTPEGWNLAQMSTAADDPVRYGPAAPDPVVDTAPGTSDNPARSLAGGPDAPLDPSGHVPRAFASHPGFFDQVGSSKTEAILLSGYVMAQGIPKLFKETTAFHFHDEGWFGKNTQTLGMDKLTHAFNTYLIAEFLHARIHRNTGGSQGDAVTAGVLAAGLMALNEISDAIEPDSGYSMQDIAMNVAGATFSVLRNSVPGLKDKLAFKIEIMPDNQIYSRVGKKHYQQQRFMFSLKGAGFDALERSPLRFLDLQVGYYASNILNTDRANGITPKQHLFVGVGLNLGELLFAKSGSRIGRAAHSVLDYVQLPYTSLRYDTTGRLGN